MLKNLFKNIGPGTLVAAAFIGPGTVTVCTLAGVRFGFTLLWAMVLSIVATIVLQEMAARIGLVYGKGLAEVVKHEIPNRTMRVLAIFLIVSAILVGNAAYEAGNISGGMLGLQTLWGNATVSMGTFEFNYLSVFIGIIAFTLLIIGNYKVIERSLVALVLIMSLSFLITALATQPDWSAVLSGLFIPSVPAEGWLMVIALVGTTVVPYNLFLHASLVREKWEGPKDLKAARADLFFSIILGGIVSIAIIVCAAAIQQQHIENASDMALALAPIFGDFATYFLGIGLFAAGITSAITAPLAAAYVAKGCFGWTGSLKSNRFRAVWISILVIGVLFSSIGLKPIEIIQFAQVANALLLPIIAIFLVWAANRSTVLGDYVNGKFHNIIAVVIVITALLLGLKSLWSIFG
ncbi:Nramp family divalent metal transporter [Luteirhabdus pelagi]|uniref:Nramp family divalent metal transporter n=1 Tax=Luteirhabdus pelagi TaxID=2792783 RepID=UPI00193A37D1|nr:Nramp family divalent metal transporter [Luteirhabdus pelagi]